MVLHFPIALILLAVGLEFLPGFKKGRDLHAATWIIWSLAALSAIVAAVLGWFLATSGDYGTELLTRHRWLGVAVAVLSVVCLILKCLKFARIYLLAKLAVVVVLGLASHDGGSMTHGKDYLTRYMPASWKAFLPDGKKKEQAQTEVKTAPETSLEVETAFNAHVLPIFDAHCLKCHGPEKSKGDLRLDTEAFILAGGEIGPAIDPEDPMASSLLERMLLPEDDEDVMPPEGKKRMTEAEIDVIRWWLSQGASFELPADQFDPAPATAMIPQGEPAVAVESPGTAPGLSHDELQAKLSALTEQGFVAKLISLETREVRIEVSLARNSISQTNLEEIASLHEHLADLDLSRCDLSAFDLRPIGRLQKLKTLNLSQTELPVSALPVLRNLQAIESLNLYGNRNISDAGAGLLSGLPNLQRLYLWKTGVSSNALELLHSTIPSVMFESGAEKLIPMPPPAGTKTDKK